MVDDATKTRCVSPDKKCLCSHGEGATGTACPKANDAKCVSCHTNYFLEGIMCKQHTNCDQEGKIVAKQGTATTNTECGRLKRCTCANNGKGATGTACPKDNNAKCVSCTGKFFLEGGSCKAWTNCDKQGLVTTRTATTTHDAKCGRQKECVCKYGTAAVGKACPRHGDPHCTSCLTNFIFGSYFLDNNTCKPHTNCTKEGKVVVKKGTNTTNTECGRLKKCRCANNGEGATGTACPKDNDAKCVSCAGKFFLDGTKCTAWTDCSKQGKTVKTPASNTNDAVCGDYFKCECENGSEATGTACPTNGGSKCVSCNSNFYLTNDACKLLQG